MNTNKCNDVVTLDEQIAWVEQSANVIDRRPTAVLKTLRSVRGLTQVQFQAYCLASELNALHRAKLANTDALGLLDDLVTALVASRNVEKGDAP